MEETDWFNIQPNCKQEFKSHADVGSTAMLFSVVSKHYNSLMRWVKSLFLKTGRVIVKCFTPYNWKWMPEQREEGALVRPSSCQILPQSLFTRLKREPRSPGSYISPSKIRMRSTLQPPRQPSTHRPLSNWCRTYPRWTESQPRSQKCSTRWWNNSAARRTSSAHTHRWRRWQTPGWSSKGCPPSACFVCPSPPSWSPCWGKWASWWLYQMLAE